ncbi:MAG TPA: tRNA (adenosine(37)-N6)-threonylcarbamoyltransferase complex transferase subunit TsaD [Actinomycetota bacterium]|nr:tRNA (adenosine(37)-N6)-threonylcarbamoyltransferase complex transferase subunit TsaD [Actinomycetota bacterium]
MANSNRVGGSVVEVPIGDALEDALDIGGLDVEGLGAEPLPERRQIGDVAPDSLVLAIETSCDETSVAVLLGEHDILANVISSQSALHERYGGIVPELASRAHVQAINPALAEALRQADVTLWDLDAVAVTIGPGLIGSLVVGVAAAKSLSALLEAPLIGVNHLEGHIYANFLEHKDSGPPLVSLIVSGGHTLLIHMQDHGIYNRLGETLDDAAGEAFDKVARYLGLGYPGGPLVDKMAANGDPEAIAFPRPILAEGYDFSFSGLKTAVLTYVEKERRAGREPDVENLCASFQEALVDVLVTKTLRAAKAERVETVALAGGVAANSRLREAMQAGCEEAGIRLFYPSPLLCTDNAAMIAGCGWHRYKRGVRTSLDVSPDPNLPIV